MDDFKRAAIEGNFVNVILGIRDRLQVIVDGKRCTERQVRDPKHGWLRDGEKKLTLKEARSIAHHAIAAIDNAVNEFNEQTR